MVKRSPTYVQTRRANILYDAVYALKAFLECMKQTVKTLLSNNPYRESVYIIWKPNICFGKIKAYSRVEFKKFLFHNKQNKSKLSKNTSLIIT